MKKIGVYLLILTLLQSIITPISTMASSIQVTDEQAAILYSESTETIDGYEDVEAIELKEVSYVIPNESTVYVLTEKENTTVTVNDQAYTLVIYELDEETDETIELYVESNTINIKDQVNEETDFEESIDKEVEEEFVTSESEVNEVDQSLEVETSEVVEEETVEQSTQDETVETEETEMKNEEPVMHQYSTTARTTIKETSTSKLGHIRNNNVRIYEKIGGKSVAAGSKYTNAVYYIKKQASQGKDVYYLISTSPSAVNGVVGWVNAKDLSTHIHVGVDKKAKTFIIKGNGKATTKAWGGSKDNVHANLSGYKNSLLVVNLTEKVGNNTWYRGKVNGKGKNVWLHSSYVSNINETKTSKLGHIRSSNVRIYDTIGGKSVAAGSKYTNAVYYIKKQAKIGSTTHYLISTSPSSTKDVVGWVNAKDLSTHNHVGLDKKAKAFYLNGKGKATTKAWGGKKDSVHSNLSSKKNALFVVNLTEKVGKNTWYRGKINGDGQNVWVHSSYVNALNEVNTSRLGHIRNSNVKIYEVIGGKSFSAGSKYTNAVYYIKKQVAFGSNTYYLISNSPSAVNGVVGWVNAKDLSTHAHVGVDKKAKVFTIKGNGRAKAKAWGGSKDYIHSNMSKFKGNSFKVNLTEKVGNNTWYRGKINGQGKNVWLHSSFVETKKKTVVVDAGHGGSDPGASGNGLTEKNLTLDISKRVERLLVNAGYAVIMTRSTDEFLELKERTTIANNSGADIFLSIHINSFTSGSANGIETWWYDKGPNPSESKQLATELQNALAKEVNMSNRGVKNGNLHVNRESKLPSALVELGFISNKSDTDKLKNNSFKDTLAQAIVQGIKNYFSK